MHLPDHYLDPMVCAAAGLISTGAIAHAVVRLRRGAAPPIVHVAGTSAAIFAAQMVNYPVAGGTSGHLVGGALAGMLLGPWAGLLAMAAVLSVQTVVFGDGGLLALGANVLNMGVIGVAVGACVNRLIVDSASQAPYATCRMGREVLLRAFAAGIAAWYSVVVAALACALEMAASGSAAAAEVVPAMLSVHATLGLAEAAITAVVVLAVVGSVSRRQWTGGSKSTRRVRTPNLLTAHAGLLLAAVAVTLAPLSSPLPDGIESAAKLFSITLDGSTAAPLLFADYAIPGIPWPAVATVLAGVLGVALVYFLSGMTLTVAGLPPREPVRRFCETS